MSDLKLRIATRKSALALAQTTMAADAIVAANAAAEPLTYELVSMTTEGDRRLDKSLASFGGKGVFIKELEIALLEGRADIAIHSLKDMPAEVLPQFVQLKALRPDLEYVPIRGNIQTRIGKLAELDGVVLAAAGLKRMGLADQVTEYFSTEQMLPASGQGILAIETLNDGTAQESLSSCHPERSTMCEAEGSRAICNDLAQILARVNDVATFCVASAEMAYLKALNAGCQFPVASFAEFVCDENSDVCGVCEEYAQTMKIRGIYWDEKSSRLLRAECAGTVNLNSSDCIQQSKKLGIDLAHMIQKLL